MKPEYHRIRFAGNEITVNLIAVLEKFYLLEIKDFDGTHNLYMLKTEFEQRKVKRAI